MLPLIGFSSHALKFLKLSYSQPFGYSSDLLLFSSSFHPPITSFLQTPSWFPISLLSPIDSFDCGRWQRPVVCHEIIVSSLPLWWVLHPQLLIYLLTARCHLRCNRKPARLHKHGAIPISIKERLGMWLGGGTRRSLCSEYTGRITGMDDWFTGEWEQDPTHIPVIKEFYCCIDWKNCAALTESGTRQQTSQYLYIYPSYPRGSCLFGLLWLVCSQLSANPC